MKRTVAITLLVPVVLGSLVALLALWLRPGAEAPVAVRGTGGEADRPPGEAAGRPRALALPTPALGDPDRAPERTLPASDPSPDGSATLIVHAVSDFSGRDLPRVRVTVRPSDGEHVPARAVSGALARLGEAPLTGDDGRATIEVPASRAWSISAASEVEGHGATRQAVPGLAAGERREVTVRVPALGDLEFFVAVVDAATGAPIAGAELNHGSESTRTGPDGVAGAFLASWRNPQLSVRAPGYVGEDVHPTAGHETPALALVVRLAPTAALVGRVRSFAGEPLDRVRIAVYASRAEARRAQESASALLGWSALPPPTAEWQAETDDAGDFRVDGLPAGAPLSVVLYRSGARLHGELPPVVLAPGEERRFDWTASAVSAIAGRVLDDEQRGVPGVALRLSPPDMGGRGGHTRTSDALGDFVFSEIPAGKWFLAGDREARSTRVRVESTTIEVPHTPARLAVELRAHVGGTIRGSVVDPDGRPTRRAIVSTSPGFGGETVFADTDAEGRFEIGPLPEGPCLLRAIDHRFASAEATAETGAEDVLLVLGLGGELSGRVVDASGAPIEALVSARAAGSPWAPVTSAKLTRSIPEGFSFGSVSPGLYDIVAREGSRIGCLHGVSVVAGEVTEEVVVRLEEGARVRVTWTGSETASIAVLHGEGVVVGDETVSPGGTRGFGVPAGALSIRVRTPAAGLVAERAITVAPGEIRELTLGLD